MQQLVSPWLLSASVPGDELHYSYYASKACTYTDSAGRPVPAPRSFKHERDPQPTPLQPAPSASDYRPSYTPQPPYPPDNTRYPQHHRTYPPSSTPVSAPPEVNDDDRLNSRKRFRNDRGNPVSSEEIFLDGPIIGMSLDRPIHVELDHSLTRELTNRKFSIFAYLSPPPSAAPWIFNILFFFLFLN